MYTEEFPGVRACVYSVLVGGYEKPYEQPIAHTSDVDFILFTDDPHADPETWQTRHEPLLFPQDAARSSRRVKLLPHLALPDYDVSIYVDNRVVLRKPPEAILDELLPDDSVFVINAHDARETVRDEFKAVIDYKLDAPWVCAEQLSHYEASHPEVLGGRPLWSGFMIRRHHDELLRRTNEIWWSHLLRYSRRDQLSLLTALAETGLQPTVTYNRARISEYHEWLPLNQIERVMSRGGELPGMAALAECERDREEAHAQLKAVQDQRDEARQELELAQGQIAALRTSRDEIVESVSWRLTSPLRRVADTVRRR